MAVTTRTVTVVEVNPGVEARPGKQMPIRLNVGGWTDGGTKRILETFYPKTAADGSLSVDLVPNSLIDPAGTYYTISEGRNTVSGFVVPEGPGPISLRTCLQVTPANTDPVVAGGVVLVDNGDGTFSLSVGAGMDLTDNGDGTWTLEAAA